MGLLLKNFHHDLLDFITTPHPDEIQLHIQSGWDTPFVKITQWAFLMEFLCTGDTARVITGELGAEIGEVVLTDHSSVHLKFDIDGHKMQWEVRLQDIELVFQVGDTVQVIAGIYLGLEGYIVRMSDDVFHICQTSTNKEVGLWCTYKFCKTNFQRIGRGFEVLRELLSFETHTSRTAANAAIF